MSGRLPHVQKYDPRRTRRVPSPLVVCLIFFLSSFDTCAEKAHTLTFSSHFLRNILLSYMVWLTATRTFKLMPHLWHQPEHIIYVPAFIAFGYYFAIMKIYALCTLHEVRHTPFSFPGYMRFLPCPVS